jgi:hypothetical protein
MATAMQSQRDVRGHRLLGGLAMAGGLCYLAMAASFLVTGDDTGLLPNLLNVLWALGALCGLVGIGMLGVLGRGLFGRIALALALLAYALASLDGLLILAGLFSSETSPLFAVSRLGTLVGMLLVGIAALVARRWTGWRMLSPFAVPLAMPLAIVAGLVTGAMVPIPLFIGLAWLLIGYAVFSTPRQA